MTALPAPSARAGAARRAPGARIASVALELLRRREVQLLVAILGLFAICTALHPQFGVSSNIAFILADSATIMVVAVGQTIVVLGRGIDLSVSPVLGIAAVSIGFPASDHNLNIWLAALFALLIGTGLGLGSGFLVSVVGIPPIIATLATLTIYGSWQFIICGGMSVINIPAIYTNFGGANLLPGVPWLIIIGAGVVAIAHLFLTRTASGRSVYAVGNNADAAFRAGLPVRRILFTTYVISGLLAGLAGFIYLCQIGSATSTSGSDGNTNLMSIAATLIGGTTLLGGRGGPIGSALGAIFLSEALQAMISFRIDELWDPAGVGVLILIAVVADRKGAPVRQLFRQPFRQPARAVP
ncbi:MAG TPA: ABC transporter permease [Acidimicrobiales bacterium]|nr:ABC transporter permease [Acidimicrobiales bacterium]